MVLETQANDVILPIAASDQKMLLCVAPEDKVFCRCSCRRLEFPSSHSHAVNVCLFINYNQNPSLTLTTCFSSLTLIIPSSGFLFA